MQCWRNCGNDWVAFKCCRRKGTGLHRVGRAFLMVARLTAQSHMMTQFTHKKLSHLRTMVHLHRVQPVDFDGAQSLVHHMESVLGLGDAAQFFRPVPDVEESCTLFIGNFGPAVGITSRGIEEYCSRFGRLHVDIPDEAKSFAFITFCNLESARTAKHALSQENVFGRQLTVKFAKLSSKYRVCQNLHAD
jgi:hypothetical protein